MGAVHTTAALALALSCLNAQAQQPLRAAPAAAPAPMPTTFLLRAVRFTGNTAFTDAELGALAADRIGQRVSFADVQALAAAVTARYRAANYTLAQAVLPQQDISAGEVELTILEGRFGRMRIERLDDVPVSDAAIEALARALPRQGPIKGAQLERVVLLMSDLPGMATQVALEAGEAVGSFDLVVEVKAAPRVNFSIDADNQGTPATGEYRIGALARINSPFGIGDNLDLRLLNSFGKGLSFGRISYELPAGGDGWRANIAYARVQYELGREFAALDAHGTANVLELGATWPVLRSRNRNLFARGGLEWKQLDDDVDAVGRSSVKKAVTANFGLTLENRDALWGGGFSSAALTVYGGRLDIASAADRAADQGPGGRRSEGRFVRASYQLSRLQAIGGPVLAYVALAGQWANHNLDSADKIAVGGPRGVRAYSGAAGVGDEAVTGTVEGRWSVMADTSLSAFYDLGRVRFNHRALPGETNTRVLAGPGLGAYTAFGRSVSLRASLAWPTRGGATPADRPRTPRAFVQVLKTF